MIGFISHVGRKPSGAISLVILGSLIALGALGPLAWHRDPLTVDLDEALVPPNRVHPLGTDQFGRDLLARIMAGARVSLLTSALTVVLGTAVGGSIGLIAGYLRG